MLSEKINQTSSFGGILELGFFRVGWLVVGFLYACFLFQTDPLVYTDFYAIAVFKK